MSARPLLYRTVLVLALALPLAALGGGTEGKEGKKAAPELAWTGPAPRADCGPSDHVESGLQGQTTLAERFSGDSMRAYTCNLELVGQVQGEGSKYMMAWFEDCAYYGTDINTAFQQHPGVWVIDAKDPRNPQVTDYLDAPAMIDPHEGLKVHEKRKLLAGMEEGAPGFAIYDLSGDCRHPVLKATLEMPGTMGHAGNFSPDGKTYYVTQSFRGLRGIMPVIDVSDPANPKHLLSWQFPGDGRPHDLYFNDDGTIGYAMQPGQFGRPVTDSSFGPNGLVILDLSDIQYRRPDPQVRVISTLFWEDGGQGQMARPMIHKGRRYVIATDEAGGGGVGGRPGACARGVPPSGHARIIDVDDPRNPYIVSMLMLEANDPANCAMVLPDPPANNYSAHYCDVDRYRNPDMAACTWRDGGLRVFDIQDLSRPREIAYYKPPARRTAFLPGSAIWSPTADRTVDHTPTQVRFRKHKGEMHLWFASQDNGFQIVRFTKSMKELLGKADKPEKADKRDKSDKPGKGR